MNDKRADYLKGPKPSFVIPKDLRARIMKLDNGVLYSIRTFKDKVITMIHLLRDAVESHPVVKEEIMESLARTNEMGKEVDRYQIPVSDSFWEDVEFFQSLQWTIFVTVGRPMDIVKMLLTAFCNMIDDGTLSIEMSIGKIKKKRR